MKKLIVICFTVWLSVVSCFAAGALDAGTYDVPIVSLTTKAPIPAIKTAFAKAFGETARVEVLPDSSKVMTLENRHMSIKVFGKTYEANVVTMDGAQVVGTKQEPFSDPVNGLLSDPVDRLETVPAAFRIPVRLDENGAQVLTITVDFMDEFMGKGEPHPTDVTLTLDWDASQLRETITSETTAEQTTATEPEQVQSQTQPHTQTQKQSQSVGERTQTQTPSTGRTQTTGDTQPAAPASSAHTGRKIACTAAVLLFAGLLAFWRMRVRRKRVHP